jgi:hypothetical protein
MKYKELLILDINISTESANFKQQLKEINIDNSIIEFDINKMSDVNWDYVLEQILKSEKCITL